jgi:hypothetical protein
VSFQQLTSMNSARGDVSVTMSQSGLLAYVVAGHGNSGCLDLAVVEEYDLATDTWRTLSSLRTARRDLNVVQLGGYIFAMGGEAPSATKCSAPNSNPARDIVPVTTIEVMGPNGRWTQIGTLSNHRYRSSSFAWGPTRTIYTVGGQTAYDSSCQCFRTSTAITVNGGLVTRAIAALTPAPPSPVPAPVRPASVPSPQPAPVPMVSGNDLCSYAVLLPMVSFGIPQDIVAYGNTERATVKNVPACGVGKVVSDQPGVWFYVSGSGGQLTALTCHSFTNFDTQLSVYDGSCNSLRCVVANDDGCDGSSSTASRVTWQSTVDRTYYILVHGWQTNPVGNFAISVRSREPLNDLCSEAEGPLAVGDSIEGSTIYATLDFGGANLSQCRSGSGDAYGNVEGVWYYTIGNGRTMTADTCDSRTDFNTKLHVFTGSCGGDGTGLTCIVSNNDNPRACDNSLTNARSSASWYVCCFYVCGCVLV